MIQQTELSPPKKSTSEAMRETSNHRGAEECVGQPVLVSTVS